MSPSVGEGPSRAGPPGPLLGLATPAGPQRTARRGVTQWALAAGACRTADGAGSATRPCRSGRSRGSDRRASTSSPSTSARPLPPASGRRASRPRPRPEAPRPVSRPPCCEGSPAASLPTSDQHCHRPGIALDPGEIVVREAGEQVCHGPVAVLHRIELHVALPNLGQPRNRLRRTIRHALDRKNLLRHHALAPHPLRLEIALDPKQRRGTQPHDHRNRRHGIVDRRTHDRDLLRLEVLAENFLERSNRQRRRAVPLPATPDTAKVQLRPVPRRKALLDTLVVPAPVPAHMVRAPARRPLAQLRARGKLRLLPATPARQRLVRIRPNRKAQLKALLGHLAHLRRQVREIDRVPAGWSAHTTTLLPTNPGCQESQRPPKQPDPCAQHGPETNKKR